MSHSGAFHRDREIVKTMTAAVTQSLLALLTLKLINS
jgi:hypothetical protein